MTASNTDFDAQFELIHKLKWKPWVGEDYNDIHGFKLLIVGESHYKWSNEISTSDTVDKHNWTRIFIHEKGLCSKPEDKHLIVRNTERALFNCKVVKKEKRKRLWKSVSFYNFIQESMLSQKHRPKVEHWKDGWDTFFKVTDILKPDYILFLGLEASNKNDFFWEALKTNGYKSKEKIEKAYKLGRTYIRTKGVITKGNDYEGTVTVIGHPSNFFSRGVWADVLAKQMPDYINWLIGDGI